MSSPTGAPVVYLDANPFIYALEGMGDDAVAMRDLLTRLRNRPGSAATSELTLAEVLAPSSTGVERPADVRRLYIDLIVWGGFIRLHPVSRDILYDTARLRTMGRFKLPDAIHVCTALEAQCTLFMSRDHRVRLPTMMRLTEPNGEGARAVMEALA